MEFECKSIYLKFGRPLLIVPESNTSDPEKQMDAEPDAEEGKGKGKASLRESASEATTTMTMMMPSKIMPT